MRRDVTLLNWAMLPAAAVMLVLMTISLMRLGDARDVASQGRTGTKLPPPPAAAEETREFLAWLHEAAWRPFTNSNNPFYTLAIQAAPPPSPPPSAPATRKFDVTYRGFLETSAGIRRAVVQVADKQVLGGLGDKIVADYAVMEIALRHLTLTNAAGTAVQFEFAKMKTLEVPSP